MLIKNLLENENQPLISLQPLCLSNMALLWKFLCLLKMVKFEVRNVAIK
jgi:hypothetical protein